MPGGEGPGVGEAVRTCIVVIGARRAEGERFQMKPRFSRLLSAWWVGGLLWCVLGAPEARASCFPQGGVQACSNGACVGTQTCDEYWSDCSYSATSTQSCSVCGRSGFVKCDAEGSLLSGTCTAYGAEVCNNCDDDGDGLVDEGLTDGACDPQGNGCTGTRTCVAGAWTCVIPPDRKLSCGSQCGAEAYRQCGANGALGPCTRVVGAGESCNGCDDDRDGIVDNAVGQGAGTLTTACVGPSGVCAGSTMSCTGGQWSSCTAPAEQCNGLDDDCDGLFDEGGVCRSDSLTCQCDPLTCAELGANCGTTPDGCGGTLSCGTCPQGQTCGADGLANVCGTGNGCIPVPMSTACAGKNCGTATDGCGGVYACGSCTGYDSCGGGGTTGMCGCTPVTAATACVGKNCGSVSNGCGGTVSCGTCSSPSTCGGGGTPNLCGCTPSSQAVACAGKNCGQVPNGCGGFHDCGSCSSPQTCGGGGTANVCGCTPISQATACAGKNCGLVSNGCGGTYSCGSCSGTNTCGGGGTANVCGCTPMTKQQACGLAELQCGSTTNGCGGLVTCGPCPTGTTCKGGVCEGNAGFGRSQDEASGLFSR